MNTPHLTSEQEQKRIRQYLLGKNLPFDLALETEDHFIQQITVLQQTQSMDFNEAFSRVKDSWKQDLAPYYPWHFIVRDASSARTRLEHQLKKQTFLNIAPKAILLAILYLTCLYLIANYWGFAVFKWGILASLSHIFFILLLYILIGVYFKLYKIEKSASYIRLSSFQSDSILIIVYWQLVLMWMGSSFIENSYQAFNNGLWFSKSIIELLLYFLGIVGGIYTLILQIKFLKVLWKIKNRLKNLYLT